MKQITSLITILFISLPSSPSLCETVSWEDLVERNELYYKKFTDVPFTGEVSGRYKGKFENGKKDGLWVNYHENGQLRSKGNWKNGKKDSLWEWYFENGQLWEKANFKDGELEGIWELFNRDGSLLIIHNWKDGELLE